jgi:hypothetical protein
LAIRLLSDCTKLLSEEIDNPNREISDMMIVTVINIGVIEVSLHPLSNQESLA